MEVAARTAIEPVRFNRERVADAIGEVDALMRAHWDEVGFYRDLPIDPDFAKYALLERQGTLRLYTARMGIVLVGYATYLIGTALHYRNVITAQQATLFLHPSYRRGSTGLKFIAYTERMLAAEGVQVIAQHVKLARDFGALLERRGYALQDLIYTKRLDNGLDSGSG